MTKKEFEIKVNSAYNETHNALLLVWNELNNGQQKKIIKNKAVEAILKRYKIITEKENENA